MPNYIEPVEYNIHENNTHEIFCRTSVPAEWRQDGRQLLLDNVYITSRRGITIKKGGWGGKGD